LDDNTPLLKEYKISLICMVKTLII